MLNDRDDKHESQEDSEYHFSDEDVSYEVDSTPKPATTSRMKSTMNFINRLSGSKRMIISLVVFLVLVFVVYKMLSPVTTQAPSTEITAPTRVVTKAEPTMPQNPVQAVRVVPSTTTTEQTQPVITITAPPVIPTPPSVVTKMITEAGAPTTVATSQQLTTQPPQQVMQPIPGQQQAAPQSQYMPSQHVVQLPHVVTAPQQVVAGTQQQIASTTQVVPGTQQVVSTAQMVPGQTTTVQTTTVPVNANPQLSDIDAKLSNMSAQNERLINQLQTDYIQRVNNFNAQNKNIQNQVQTLNARVASLEAQLNQLTQQLTGPRTTDKTTTINTTTVTTPPPPPRIPYSVQAIIPGRAWLRSDTGDTVTVAEGDIIKGVGRVSKIDPYDGVVEINIGTRAVSLSYGN